MSPRNTSSTAPCTTTTSTTAAVPGTARDPFVALRDEGAVLPTEALAAVNTDLSLAAFTALDAARRCREYRAEFERHATLIDVREIDRIELLARYVVHTHTAYANAVGAASPSDALTRGIIVRDSLADDARALVKHEILPAQAIAGITGGHSYRDVGFDLNVIVTGLESNAAAIEGNTPVKAPDLAEARAISDKLMFAAVQRERSNEAVTAALLDRQRAFSLLTRAYSQLRRAVTFLRWDEGDANELAPSLYVRSSASRKSTEPDEETAAGPDKPAPIISLPAAPASPSAHAATLAALTQHKPGDPITVPQNDPFGRPS